MNDSVLGDICEKGEGSLSVVKLVRVPFSEWHVE